MVVGRKSPTNRSPLFKGALEAIKQPLAPPSPQPPEDAHANVDPNSHLSVTFPYPHSWALCHKKKEKPSSCTVNPRGVTRKFSKGKISKVYFLMVFGVGEAIKV